MQDIDVRQTDVGSRELGRPESERDNTGRILAQGASDLVQGFQQNKLKKSQDELIGAKDSLEKSMVAFNAVDNGAEIDPDLLKGLPKGVVDTINNYSKLKAGDKTISPQQFAITKQRLLTEIGTTLNGAGSFAAISNYGRVNFGIGKSNQEQKDFERQEERKLESEARAQTAAVLIGMGIAPDPTKDRQELEEDHATDLARGRALVAANARLQEKITKGNISDQEAREEQDGRAYDVISFAYNRIMDLGKVLNSSSTDEEVRNFTAKVEQLRINLMEFTNKASPKLAQQLEGVFTRLDAGLFTSNKQEDINNRREEARLAKLKADVNKTAQDNGFDVDEAAKVLRQVDQLNKALEAPGLNPEQVESLAKARGDLLYLYSIHAQGLAPDPRRVTDSGGVVKVMTEANLNEEDGFFKTVREMIGDVASDIFQPRQVNRSKAVTGQIYRDVLPRAPKGVVREAAVRYAEASTSLDDIPGFNSNEVAEMTARQDVANSFKDVTTSLVRFTSNALNSDGREFIGNDNGKVNVTFDENGTVRLVLTPSDPVDGIAGQQLQEFNQRQGLRLDRFNRETSGVVAEMNAAIAREAQITGQSVPTVIESLAQAGVFGNQVGVQELQVGFEVARGEDAIRREVSDSLPEGVEAEEVTINIKASDGKEYEVTP